MTVEEWKATYPALSDEVIRAVAAIEKKLVEHAEELKVIGFDRDVWKQRAESRLVNYKAALKGCKGWMEAQFCPEEASCGHCSDGRRIAKEAGALIGEEP